MTTIVRRSLWARLFLRGKIFLLRVTAATVLRFLVRPWRRLSTVIASTSPSIRCVAYYPQSYSSNNRYPVYVNLHGGGFVAGNAADDSEFCSFIAKQVGCIVIAPEYRLAPEYPFPIGLNDCVSIVKWARLKFQPTKIAVGGFSAGGTLALGVAQIEPLASVIAFYCPMDFSSSSDNDFKEKDPMIRNMFHEAYLLTTDAKTLNNPLLSPAYAPVSAVPNSVVIIAAGIDPNIRDILKFMEKMREKEHFVGKVYENVFHGWNYIPEILLGKDGKQKKWDAYQLVAQELKRAFE